MARDTNSISANLQRLHNRIADICARCQRRPSDIALMAVSKLHPPDAIAEAFQAGQRLFGENRVQEWLSKSRSLAALLQNRDLRMHLIGPLQNNKTARAAELFHAVDTLDSLKTAQRLNDAAQALQKTLPVLVEVKLSPEATKHGLDPHDPRALPALLDALAPLSHLRLSGLMTVPPWSEDPETARPCFQRLRRLRDENIAAHPTLTELSMGMSNDFQVAIEEGSTTLRLGTAIFGKRAYP